MKDQQKPVKIEDTSTLLERWLSDLRNSPHFSGKDFSQKDGLESISKSLLHDIARTLEQHEVPSFERESLEPLLKLWHATLHTQGQKGFSTKDTAMLLFSLKTTLVNHIKESEPQKDEKESLKKLNQLLDILGLLTFEVYSVEKERVLSRHEEQIQYLQNNLISANNIIGNSPEINAVYKAIGVVLENDVTVLLEGESGTGKDLIANIIHQSSKRKNKPFITINCGAIPRELIESELFGHEKGAYTGAEGQRIGKFELAHDGTLFLDEIGELPLDLQVKLLRALQNQEIERVGGSEKVKVNTRIIAATNRNLKEMVDEGKFRLDLYYRVNVYPIHIPALRERQADIIPLATYFLNRYEKEFNVSTHGFSEDAKNFLLENHWEGNIRELENTVQRAVLLGQNSVITAQTLQMHPGKTSPALLPELTQTQPTPNRIESDEIIPLEEVEKRAIDHALRLKKGNIKKVAEELKISRTTLYSKMKKFGLEDPEK